MGVDPSEGSKLPEESVFRDACAMAGAGVWAVLPEGDWTVWWSPEMFDLFGLPRDASPPRIGEGFTHYHPDDTGVIARGWKVASTSDTPVRSRYRIFRADGEMRHLLSKARRMPPNSRGERWILGLDTDVTDLLVDEALLVSERALRFVAENTKDLILRISPKGEVEFASNAAMSLLGYTPEDLVGRNVEDLVNLEDRLATAERIRLAIAERKRSMGTTLDYRVRRADGAEIWLEGSPRPVYDGDGKYLGYVDVVRDVSRRKELEAEAAEARRSAEAAAKAKSDFLANMSHELRTPLTSILGFGRLIGRNGGLSAEDQRHVDLIQAAGQSLLTVVNDILDFSKLEAGGLTLDSQPIDVGDLVGSVVAMLSEQARGKSIDLRLHGDDAVIVLGDPSRLRQILINLVSNAVKFTDHGAVDVEFRVSAMGGDAVRLTFSVTDTGIGIPLDQQSRIFSRFTQVDSTGARRFGGTGLGLAICQKLVDLMDGEIGVESDGRTGSRFWFQVVLPSAEALSTDRSEAAGDFDLGANLKILVAEDHPANRALLGVLLEGTDVTFAENGEEAVQLCERANFDIVLMDMQMPILDGLGATRAIRSLPSPHAHVPVVALTANVLPDQILACRAAGMDGHVAKPIDALALYEAIRIHARPCQPDARRAETLAS